MNYYYDIVLNFLENNYYFYEWEENDNIEYIKKIPIYHVENKIYDDFYCNKVKVSKDFLTKIENKTVGKNCNLKYTCLIANKNNVYAYEFNEEGLIINRSALTLNDELNILEYLYTIPVSYIEYEIVNKINFNNNLRKTEYIKKIINMEIDKLYKSDNINKLKFIYIEWFNKKENNMELIYRKIKNSLNNEDINENLINIYNMIKLSYNNV